MDQTTRENFKSHRLNQEGQEKSVTMAQKFTDLVSYLETVCTTPHETTPNRSYAIALMKLEEAGFFAKKAMASQVGNQEGSGNT